MLLALALSALAGDPRVDPAVHPVSPRHLSFTVIDGPAPTTTGWALLRPDGTRVDAASAQRRTRAAALVPEDWPYPAVPEHTVLVEFATAWGVAPGDYTLLHDGVETRFAWDPAEDLATAIHLSPAGQRPDALEALALVSTWNVGGAPITLAADEQRVSIVDDATGRVVREGNLRLRTLWDTTRDDAYGSSFARANTYQLDLTALPEGAYHLRWEGVGRSWSFRVAADAWDAPFLTVLRALMHQRCGHEVPANLSRWARPACHVAPVEQTTADYRVVGEDAFEALPAAATGTFVDAAGGYHDAADYDRNIGHVAVAHTLVELWETNPAKFARDDLGIPESGNGLPDLLDEALWALRPWAGLQTADGGVPGAIGTTRYPPYDLMPQDDTGRWFVTVPDAQSTTTFAAAAAAVARALQAHGDADEAQDWRERAERAWSWAQAHPVSDDDARVSAAHAAAELARLTGETRWFDAYRTAGPFRDGLGWRYAAWDPAIWDDGLWAIARSRGEDGGLVAAASAALMARADALVTGADARSVPQARQAYARVAFGSATTPRESRLLHRAWELTGRDDYLRVATLTAAATLGMNATGTGWVTGIGPNAVRFPLHTPSLADGIADPVAGIPVYGPASDESSRGILGAALAVVSPAIGSWPLVERFADVSYVPGYNEFTVTESIAPTIYAFGVLAELAPAQDDTGTTDTGMSDTGDNVDSGTDTAGDDAPTQAASVEEGGCGCATNEGDATRNGPLVFAALMVIATVRRRRRQP